MKQPQRSRLHHYLLQGVACQLAALYACHHMKQGRPKRQLTTREHRLSEAVLLRCSCTLLLDEGVDELRET